MKNIFFVLIFLISFNALAESDICALLAESVSSQNNSSTSNYMKLVTHLVKIKNAFSYQALKDMAAQSSTPDPLQYVSDTFKSEDRLAFGKAFASLKNVDWKIAKGELDVLAEEINETGKVRENSREETKMIFYPLFIDKVYAHHNRFTIYDHDEVPFFSRYYDPNHKEIFSPGNDGKYPFPGNSARLETSCQLAPDHSIYADSTEWKNNNPNVGEIFEPLRNLFIINMKTGQKYKFDMEKMGLGVEKHRIPSSLEISYFSGPDKKVKVMAPKPGTDAAANVSFIDLNSGLMQNVSYTTEKSSIFITKKGRVFIFDPSKREISITEVKNPLLKSRRKLKSYKITIPGDGPFEGEWEMFEDAQGLPHFISNDSGVLTHFDLTRETAKVFNDIIVHPRQKKSISNDTVTPTYDIRLAGDKIYMARLSSTIGKDGIRSEEGITLFNLTDNTSQKIDLSGFKDFSFVATVLIYRKDGEGVFITSAMKGWDNTVLVRLQMVKDGSVHDVTTEGLKLGSLQAAQIKSDGRIEGFFATSDEIKRVQLFGPVEKP